MDVKLFRSDYGKYFLNLFYYFVGSMWTFSVEREQLKVMNSEDVEGCGVRTNFRFLSAFVRGDWRKVQRIQSG